MEINTSTYETIFLLYIDKELSQKESLEVDAFIAKNPSYALLMEELKATVLVPESLRFPIKASLKKQEERTVLEATEEDDTAIWSHEYANYLMEDMQAIPGLSSQFKNSLKKEAASKSVLIKAFGFNQNKFTYTAVAALLMLFIGYKKMVKTPASNTVIAKNANSGNNASELSTASVPTIEDLTLIPSKSAYQTINSVANNTRSEVEASDLTFTQESTEPILDKVAEKADLIAPNANVFTSQSLVANEIHSSIKNTNIDSEKITNNKSNTISNSTNLEEEIVKDISSPVSYEIIDTDDPNRTIYIANFEIDGNKLRGLKRRVGSLFKSNKSDRNK